MVKMISEFNEHDHIQGQFLVANITKGVNATGMPYFNVECRDASGSINGKKWDTRPEDDNIFVTGAVVLLDAEVIKYKDALQLKILSAENIMSISDSTDFSTWKN